MSVNYEPGISSPSPIAQHRSDWLDAFYMMVKAELAKEYENEPEEDSVLMTGQEVHQRSILEQVYDPAYTSHSPIAKNANVRHDDGTDFPEPKNTSLLGGNPEEADLEMDNEKRADYDYIPDSMLAETSLKSELDPNHEQKGSKKLSDLNLVKLDKDTIAKHRDDPGWNMLKHLRPSEECTASVGWFDNDKLAAIVSVSYPGGTRKSSDGDYNWITALEVHKDYQGYGLGKQVLDYAVKTLHGNALGVNVNNKVAQAMYDKYGFRKSKESEQEVKDGKSRNYLMYLNETASISVEKKYRRIFVSTTSMVPAMLKNLEKQRNGMTSTTDEDGKEVKRGPWDRAFGDIGKDDLWIHLGKYCTGEDPHFMELKSLLNVECTKAMCEFEPYGNDWMTPKWVKGMLGFDYYGDNIKVSNLIFSECAFPTQKGMINVFGERVDDPVYDLYGHVCVDDIIAFSDLPKDRPILIDDLFVNAKDYMEYPGESFNNGKSIGRYARHPKYDIVLTDAKKDKWYTSPAELLAQDYEKQDEALDESMTKAEKDKLPDNMFGLPKQRKYPLHDEKHVRAAISMFHHCKDPEDRKTLAHNICRRIKELNLDIQFRKDSPIYPYAPKDLRLDESISGFFGLNAMLDIPMNEAADWIGEPEEIINEGETAVADDGTSSDSDTSSVSDPWYKRLDLNGDFPNNLLKNKERGPASSKQSKNIDYDKYQSELG